MSPGTSSSICCRPICRARPRPCRALIEEMAAREPSVARLLEAARRDEREPALRGAIALPPNIERDSVSRTRAALRWRGWLLGLAIACTLMPLAMAFSGGHVTFVLFYDKPASQVLWLLALAFWFAYSALGRRLSSGTNS